MDGIRLKLNKIKNIDEFEMVIPDEKGLYALTGENGSGKSTIITCAAASFYNTSYKDYFGDPRPGAKIEFQYHSDSKIIEEHDGIWKAQGDLHITGFYEGSIIFGTRFRNMNFNLISTLSQVREEDLTKASDFVIKGLGNILHDDENYYNDLLVMKKKVAKEKRLKRMNYYYKHKGSLINQLNMSTGENLLLTILSSLQIRLNKENYGESPTFLFLDEVELALHSSALRRLIYFLKEIANKYNMVVMFSTHSIELVRSIPPTNIYYLQSYNDGSLDVLNPCYPIYATRNLESANYGYDCVILVEDTLSKKIIDKILLDKQLLNNKRIAVMAIGGWPQVIKFAYEAINSNLMIKNTKIIMVLDGDIKNDVNKFIKNEHIGFADEPQYLPIKSLEKYLLKSLVVNVDKDLFNKLDNYVFQRTSLKDLIHKYNKDLTSGSLDGEKVKNGKAFYSILKNELNQIRKDDEDIISVIIEHLFNSNNKDIDELTMFFLNKFESL